MEKTPVIFWLASWYPTRLDPFPGDFIQRHAKALSLYYPVHVLHITKDEKRIMINDILIEENTNANLHETIVYYYPPKTGLSFFDRVLSLRKFLKTGKKLINQKVKNHPLLFIHVHVAMRHGLLALWAKRVFGIKYVITEHWTGYDQAYPKDLKLSKWFWVATKKIFNHASYFYPEVKRMGELINDTITKIPYKPVSNSVDTGLFYPANVKAKPIEIFHFIHVSTLSHQKNIKGILRVIEKWAMHNSNVHFTLVGPAWDEVIKNVNSSPTLSKIVTITGVLAYYQVAEEMRQAHALLMFSRYENQPCVILEALCCGLPVISTNVGGIAEVIDSTNGILIRNENEDDLYAAMSDMVINYNRFDLAGIAAKAQSLYSYETTGKQILAYYKEDMPEFF